MSMKQETSILIPPPDSDLLTSKMLGDAIITVEYGDDGTPGCKYLGFTHKNGKRLYLFMTPTLSMSFDEKQLCAQALNYMKLARIEAAK